MKFTSSEFKWLPHPTYSLDLSHRDYTPLANLKNWISEQRLESNEEAISAVKEYYQEQDIALQVIGYITKLEHPYEKCIGLSGD